MAREEALIEPGGKFLASHIGRWANERLMRALKEGRPLSPSVLRTLDVLRKDEWKVLDDTLIQSAAVRLRGIADLRTQGLVKSIAGGMGKTIFEYEKVGDMNPAEISMDGAVMTEDDRVDFELGSVPLPLIHKNYTLNIRTLMASRARGEALDTIQSEICGRLIAEKLEDLLFNGYATTFNGLPIYGYFSHPKINTQTFTSGAVWTDASTSGAEILTDVLGAIGKLIAARMYGPYILYIPTLWALKLQEDFKTESDKSIWTRLLEIRELIEIRSADMMPTDKALLVQMTSDVVVLLEGEPLQTVQWDTHGGFRIVFKAFTLSVPLIRTDIEDRCGICQIKAA